MFSGFRFSYVRPLQKMNVTNNGCKNYVCVYVIKVSKNRAKMMNSKS